MKVYNAPSVEFVELKVEERFASGTASIICKNGACHKEDGTIIWYSPSGQK